MATYLYDARGNLVDTGALKEDVAAPDRFDFRPVVSGHPAQGLNPQRLASILRQAEYGEPLSYFELAEEMEEKDLHYRSVLATRKNQVAGLEITVEAASDDAQDVKRADFIRDWLQRDELRLELFDILDAVGKGLSLVEIRWDTTGKQWVPSGLEWRDPRWFLFSEQDGGTPLLRSVAGPKPLPAYKFIRHEHKSKSGLALRGGLARAASWGYLFKNFDVKAWVAFAEVYGVPVRVGKYGQGASDKDKQVLLEAVTNIANDAAAIIPASMALEFVEAKISGNLDLFERLAEFLDKQISKAVLGQTGTTDVGQHVGTANAHEQVRQDIETADAVQLSATLNRDLVRPMIDLNFGAQKLYPRVKIFRPDSEDMEKEAKILATLVPLGLRVEESVVRDKLGWPDPAPDAVTLQTQRTETPLQPIPEPGALPVEKPGKALQSAVHSAAPPAPPSDAIDQAVAEELGDWQPLVKPLVDPIQALLEDCLSRGQDLETFRRRLAELPAKQDPSALAGHLGGMLFKAQGLGETGEDLDLV
ncbi:DUF935 domain-containing protein [Fundidesulfovibrio butyratiphilus]